VVKTVGLQRNFANFKQWLDQGDPFIIVGPEGCGKSLMIRYAFSQIRSLSVATI